MCRLLKAAEPPNSNIRRVEKQALQALCREDSVVVLKSDKGNASVILDNAEYQSKMMAILWVTPFERSLRTQLGGQKEL